MREYSSASSPSRRHAIATGSIALASLLTANKPGNNLFAAQAAGELSLDSLNGKKILFFTKSAGFEHSVVKREGDAPALAERMMKNFGKKYSFEVTMTKDGTVFDRDYADYDCFFFYTSGDLTSKEVDPKQGPPISNQGKANLLKAIADGKGFVGSHCAADTYHSVGDRWQNQAEPDPYIQMIGGEFSGHGRQQKSTMTVADLNFPGIEIVGASFSLQEEWYSLKNFAPDLHVILVQETEGMADFDYERPAYPATWARRHEKGRVFYTSMGHREDVWTNPTFESILLGGLAWASGAIQCEIPPNITEVTPDAATLPVKK